MKASDHKLFKTDYLCRDSSAEVNKTTLHTPALAMATVL